MNISKSDPIIGTQATGGFAGNNVRQALDERLCDGHGGPINAGDRYVDGPAEPHYRGRYCVFCAAKAVTA